MAEMKCSKYKHKCNIAACHGESVCVCHHESHELGATELCREYVFGWKSQCDAKRETVYSSVSLYDRLMPQHYSIQFNGVTIENFRNFNKLSTLSHFTFRTSRFHLFRSNHRMFKTDRFYSLPLIDLDYSFLVNFRHQSGSSCENHYRDRQRG